MAAPYPQAFHYCAQSIRDAIARDHPTWESDPKAKTRVYSYFWAHAGFDRTPYEQAFQSAVPRDNAPRFAYTLPARAPSQAEVNGARTSSNGRSIVGALPGIGLAGAGPGYAAAVAPVASMFPAAPALPAAPAVAAVPVAPVVNADPDQYPYPFWPPVADWDRNEPTATELGDCDEEMDDADGMSTNQYIKHVQNLFLRSATYAPDEIERHQGRAEWRGQRWAGRGSYGKAGVWIKIDHRNRIVDRMVIKDATSTADKWNSPLYWRRRMPMEMYFHRLIEGHRGQGHPGYRHIIESRGARLFMKSQRYRLYLELYELGNMSNINMWHEDLPEFVTEMPEPMFMPEEYIWFVARALVDACLVLKQGSAGEAIDGWDAINHCDLTLANVFLTRNPNSTGDPEEPFPIPVVADFGISFSDFTTVPEDVRMRGNPELFRVGNGPRWPPELNLTGAHGRPIDEKADVWLIGSLIWSLICQKWMNGPQRDHLTMTENESHRALVSEYPGPVVPEGEWILTADTGPEARGSEWEPLKQRRDEALREFARMCMRYDEDHRPTLLQLQEYLDEAMDQMPPGYSDRRPHFAAFEKDDFADLNIGADAPEPPRSATARDAPGSSDVSVSDDA